MITYPSQVNGTRPGWERAFVVNHSRTPEKSPYGECAHQGSLDVTKDPSCFQTGGGPISEEGMGPQTGEFDRGVEAATCDSCARCCVFRVTASWEDFRL